MRNCRIRNLELPFLLILSFCFTQTLFARVVTTYIKSQEQFDQAVDLINEGKEMHLRLASRHFYLKGGIQAKAPLSIKGKNATINCCTDSYGGKDVVRTTATHHVYRLKMPLTIYPLFYEPNGDLLRVSESVIDSIGVNHVEGEIIVPNDYSAGVQIQIPVSSNLIHLKNKTFTNAFGYIDSGWGVVNFSLERSDGKYFYCTTLNNCSTKNYEYDRKVYKKPVRYVIYNAEQKLGAIYYDKDYLYVPKTVEEVCCVSRKDICHQEPHIKTYSDITLDGIRFVGFDGIEVHSNENSICKIHNCHFQNSLGAALSIDKKTGLDVREANVSSCTFDNCSLYNDMVVMLSSSTYDGGDCINMRDCTVARYNDGRIGYKNPQGAVYVSGNIILTDNVVYNSCRDHFFLVKGHITATNNVLFNTDEFNAHLQRNFSSDWGLVYCNHIFKDTQEALDNTTHRILLEKNLLYGAFAYGKDARGIFIDDGRGDVECVDNVVLNTQIYSIDARDSKLMEASSVRNRYEGNIVTSRYRLAAGASVTGDNIPLICANRLLTDNENVTANVQTKEKDIQLALDTKCSLYEGKIYVKKELYRVLKRNLGRKCMKRAVQHY